MARVSALNNSGSGLNLLAYNNSGLNSVFIDRSQFLENEGSGIFASTQATGYLSFKVRNSDLIDNATAAVEISAAAGVMQPDLGTHLEAGNNAFLGGDYHLIIERPYTITYAEGNWWGVTNIQALRLQLLGSFTGLSAGDLLAAPPPR